MERVKSLSRFQFKILTYALSYSIAKYVVYSTCSIYEEENEQVVKDILSKQVKYSNVQWKLVDMDSLVNGLKFKKKYLKGIHLVN